MDFFSYLQNSGKNSKNNNEHKDIQKLEILSNSNDIKYNNFKRGEIIKIIRFENSKFNIYKGYFAEIKSYKKDSDHAYVILLAQNYPKLIKIPISHFHKIE
jgi:hypothetical protein